GAVCRALCVACACGTDQCHRLDSELSGVEGDLMYLLEEGCEGGGDSPAYGTLVKVEHEVKVHMPDIGRAVRGVGGSVAGQREVDLLVSVRLITRMKLRIGQQVCQVATTTVIQRRLLAGEARLAGGPRVYDRRLTSLNRDASLVNLQKAV